MVKIRGESYPQGYNTRSCRIKESLVEIVYIAPMKALVQEMVSTFTKRLTYLDIKAAELTGDSQLTKQQITETQIIKMLPIS